MTKLEEQIEDSKLCEEEWRKEEIHKEIKEDLSRSCGGHAFQIMLNISLGKIRHVYIDYERSKNDC